MTIYTAISFAPVQGFIEKSRKLRDLYGASLILSYLSQKIVKEFHHPPELEVISPGLPDVQKGMPNRILIKGLVDRDRAKNVLLKHWQHLLQVCRKWVEKYVPTDYHWSQRENQIGKEKGEWERWGSHAWEVFWGKGDSPQAAMEDLETRKLKRDWTAINWMGESSSLSGTDAIAWPQLGRRYELGEYQPGRSLSDEENQELELFYRRLSWLLDDPEQRKGNVGSMSMQKLKEYEAKKPDDIGRYIAINERLSIPELVKRLITYDKIDEHEPGDGKLNIEKLKKTPKDPEFKDIYREPGYWTGWFMGDGDKIGDKLKQLVQSYPNDLVKQEQEITRFSELMRDWGRDFEARPNLFPEGKGRVIYAGGDDFLGVLYSEKPEPKEVKTPEPIKPIDAWNWLCNLPQHWKDLKDQISQEIGIDLTYSVGFIWAGHKVPQRDILQHCREAEQRSKKLDRNRVTIRVVFNSGQYVQWTCPWDNLDILTKYHDRNGGQNWTHIYNDWATLKARHAIRLQALEGVSINKEIALKLFDLYFDEAGKEFQQKRKWDDLTGNNTDQAIVQWIDDLIQVGWQLCRDKASPH